ncbi:MAG: AtuA-related protein, partial [Caulobacter sp.]
EILGAEASYGANASEAARSVREVVCRIGAEHESAEALGLMTREFASPTTSMSVGTTGWFGGAPTITPVSRVFSILLPRQEVAATVSLGDQTLTITPASPARAFDPAEVVAPPVPADPAPEDDMVAVPLIDVAWARSGDKGDAFNIGVIARRPELLPWIRAGLSEERVKAWFAHEFEGATAPKVIRYELPGMNAINLHCIQALGGGQFSSLRLDPLAKGKAQQLLDIRIDVPRVLAAGH